MKITVVTKEKKMYEIKDVEFFTYDAMSKNLEYFSHYKYITVPCVEIMSCMEDN